MPALEEWEITAHGFLASQLTEHIREMDDGSLVVEDCPIARTGFQTYAVRDLPQESARELGIDLSNPNASIDLYRPASEVFRPEFLASLEGRPIVDSHPPGFVTPENFNQYAKGHIQNVRKGEQMEDGELPVIADLVISAEPLVSKVRNKTARDVSLGYDFAIRRDGKKITQCEMIANHAAIVPSGRAGDLISIGDAAPSESPPTIAPSANPQGAATSLTSTKAAQPKKEKPVANLLKHLKGLALTAYAKDSEDPEKVAEAAEVLNNETPPAEATDKGKDSRTRDGESPDEPVPIAALRQVRVGGRDGNEVSDFKVGDRVKLFGQRAYGIVKDVHSDKVIVLLKYGDGTRGLQACWPNDLVGAHGVPDYQFPVGAKDALPEEDDQEDVEDRKPRGRDRKPAKDAHRQRMHDALDDLLDKEDDGESAEATDADLEELKSLLGQFFSEEEAEPQHEAADIEEPDTAELDGVLEGEPVADGTIEEEQLPEEVQDAPEPAIEEEDPDGEEDLEPVSDKGKAKDRARAADGAAAVLKTLRKSVAHCGDADVQRAFNAALGSVTRASKAGTGSHAAFSTAARARDGAPRTPAARVRAMDQAGSDSVTRLQNAYNTAHKGGK